MQIADRPLVLIADGNQRSSEDLAKLLRSVGFYVWTTTEAARLLQQVANLNPDGIDLVVIDTQLADLRPEDLPDWLRVNQLTQQAPTMLIVPETEQVNGLQGLDVDAIVKPVLQEDLLKRIQLHCQLRSLQRQLQQETAAHRQTALQLGVLKQQLTGQVLAKAQAINSLSERLKTQEAELRQGSERDPLTGLLNRHAVLQYLTRGLMDQSADSRSLAAVMLIDLDRFKRTNHCCGYRVGDILLCSVTARLNALVPHDSVLGRLGKDQFLLLVPGSRSRQDIETIAQRILVEISRPFHIKSRHLQTGASIGIVSGPSQDCNVEGMLRDIDAALTLAKQAGGNQFVVLTNRMRQQAADRLQLEADLLEALDQNQFRLYYQPIFSLRTCQLAGFEALIRWEHPTRGLLLPGQFIAIAEDIGCVQAIDLWVLKTACKQLRTWQQSSDYARDVFININFSPIQIQHMSGLQNLDVLDEYADLTPGSLKLEITESGLHPETGVLHILEQFEQQGVRLCIDDFGTGYSSLSRLHHLPISTLKIDRSFIARLLTSSDGFAVVETIVSLAHTLGMDVVAEGIENADQLNELQILGCEYGQGFLFSEPLQAQSATHLISKTKPVAWLGQRKFKVGSSCLAGLAEVAEPAAGAPAEYVG